MTTKLLLIDFQNDFITGSLAVDGAIQDVQNTIEFIKRKQDEIDHVVFTADMHPKSHISFKSSWNCERDYMVTIKEVLDGTATHSVMDKETLLIYLYHTNVSLYPDHCVWGTTGAMLEESIEDIVNTCFDTRQSTYLKGLSIGFEQYSAAHSYIDGVKFKFLNEFKDCKKIYVAGEALDFCVYNTVSDMVKLGIEPSKIIVLEDCTSAINYDKYIIEQFTNDLGVKVQNSKEV